MFEEFIRGRTYYTRSKQSVIDRKPTIKRVAKLKRKIQASITRSFFVKGAARIKRQKTLSNSYSRRFILPNKLSLLKRTMYFEPRLFFEYQEEDFAFDKLRQNLRRYEANKMLSSIKGFQSSIKMLADKAIFFGRVYLTHKRRNTFITISDFPEYGVFANQRIVYKSSCGLQAYSGPKRSTPHARMSVAKAAGAFLRENEYTSIDLVFPSKYGRFFTRFVRTISENLYVRYIQISKRRPHSKGARKKKKRRL